MCYFESHLSQTLLPYTYYLCSTADDYCGGTHYVNDYGSTCCGEQGYPCCIDCYYCFTPISAIIDILFCPYTIYVNYNFCKKQPCGNRDTSLAASI